MRQFYKLSRGPRQLDDHTLPFERILLRAETVHRDDVRVVHLGHPLLDGNATLESVSSPYAENQHLMSFRRLSLQS